MKGKNNTITKSIIRSPPQHKRTPIISALLFIILALFLLPSLNVSAGNYEDNFTRSENPIGYPYAIMNVGSYDRNVYLDGFKAVIQHSAGKVGCFYYNFSLTPDLFPLEIEYDAYDSHPYVGGIRFWYGLDPLTAEQASLFMTGSSQLDNQPSYIAYRNSIGDMNYLGYGYIHTGEFGTGIGVWTSFKVHLGADYTAIKRWDMGSAEPINWTIYNDTFDASIQDYNSNYVFFCSAGTSQTQQIYFDNINISWSEGTTHYANDTDGGLNITVKGITYNGTTTAEVSVNDTVETDLCFGDKYLWEYYLDGYNVEFDVYTCTDEGFDYCTNGTCSDTPPVTTTTTSTTTTTLGTTETCRDSDGNTPQSIGQMNTNIGLFYDDCLSSDTLREYFCIGNVGVYEDYNCSSLGFDYCENGKCRDDIYLNTSNFIVDISTPNQAIDEDAQGLLPDLYHGVLEFFRHSMKPILFIFIVVMIAMLFFMIGEKFKNK